VKFLDVIGDWLNEHFSNKEAIYLILLIAATAIVLATLGGVLAPVITGLIIAFLLQGVVKNLERAKVPSTLAVYIAVMVFVSVVITVALFLFPLIWQQLTDLAQLLPKIIPRLREGLADLQQSFPEFVSKEQISVLLDQGARELGNVSATVLETAFSQVFSVLGLLIYLVLVPITVFFFLKDKDLLLEFAKSLLPKNRPLLDTVGNEMNLQLGNYVRGKVIEILVVGSTTFVALTILDLNYAALLGVFVGLSVIIPYVGAALVTIPVFIVALFQFGWGSELAIVMSAYGVIQFLDGNVLVPLLFSEVVDLHPITIIVAVLAFGGLWGVWGVFFAIPLATLVKAIYKAWPRIEVIPKIAGARDVVKA
jgi:putative permease